MLRPYNMATGAAPFDKLNVADLGDVPINTYSLEKSIDIISDFYDTVLAAGCAPLTLGGDHTIALPILRALARKHGPVALVHVDAHADVNDDMFGERIAHGTPFRRAVEEGLLACDKVCRSACAAPAMRRTISTGRANRASQWCRRTRSGTSRWRR